MKNTQFVQKAKVGVAGSFFNQLMSNNASIPEVGKGATKMHYTDRTCYEVISVSDDLKTVRLEALDAEIDLVYLKSQNGRDCTGHQNWILKPTGRFLTVVYRHGAWRTKSEVVRFTKEYIKKVGEGVGLAGTLSQEQRQAVYAGDVRPKNVVEGITEKKFEYHKINLLFGQSLSWDSEQAFRARLVSH